MIARYPAGSSVFPTTFTPSGASLSRNSRTYPHAQTRSDQMRGPIRRKLGKARGVGGAGIKGPRGCLAGSKVSLESQPDDSH